MKLVERLLVNDADVALISAEVVLHESSPGRAVFTVRSEEKLKGIVFYDLGYAKHNFYRYFIGYIDNATQTSNKSWKLVCHEVIEGLSVYCPISLRNCFLSDVLRDVTKSTKIKFELVKGSYTSISVPRFANDGDGLQAIRYIERIFNVPDFVFYQLRSGAVWLGSYKDSPFADKPGVSIPMKFFTNHKANNRITVPVIPALRPGHVVNDNRLSRIIIINQVMRLQWKD